MPLHWLQETNSRKAEAWAAVERTLNSRLQVLRETYRNFIYSWNSKGFLILLHRKPRQKLQLQKKRSDLLMNAFLKPYPESMFLRLRFFHLFLWRCFIALLPRNLLTNLVLQISCLRAEQTQLTRSLDKERQRAAENRQEYLALKEEAETNEGRVNQLEEEIKELRRKHKQEIQEALTHQELLRQVTKLCFTFLLICCLNPL